MLLSLIVRQGQTYRRMLELLDIFLVIWIHHIL